MRLQNLFESPAVDIDRAMDAREAFSRFTDWLSRRNQSTPLDDCGMLRWHTRDDELWMVSTADLGIDMPDAYIGIGWRRGGRTNVQAYVTTGTSPNGRFSMLVMLLPDDPGKEVDLAWRLNLSTFSHEYTHLGDYRRGYLRHRENMTQAFFKRGKRWGAAAHGTPEETRAYFNSPVEFNGYYQQGVENLIKSLQMSARHSRRSFARTYLASYQHFYYYARPDFYTEWLTNLDASYKRRFDKRLYKFYELVRSQWPDLEVLQRIRQASRAALERWKAENPEEAAEIDWSSEED